MPYQFAHWSEACGAMPNVGEVCASAYELRYCTRIAPAVLRRGDVAVVYTSGEAHVLSGELKAVSFFRGHKAQKRF